MTPGEPLLKPNSHCPRGTCMTTLPWSSFCGAPLPEFEVQKGNYLKVLLLSVAPRVDLGCSTVPLKGWSCYFSAKKCA